MLKLEKLPQIIATVGIMIYIMGFITITSYLNSLHIVESVSIDGKLLKTGILTLFLIIPLLGFFVTQFKDGNFVDNVPAKLLRITLLIAYIDVFFNNYVMINSVNNAQIALIFIGLLIGFFEKVFPAKFEKVKELISVILLIVILTIAILSSFKISTYLPDLSLFAFHGIIILGFLTYFLIIDEKNYLKTSALFSAFLGICLGCTFLGGRLLSQIKPQYGGETQKYCRLFFKADFITAIKDSKLSNELHGKNNQLLKIAYETESKYFIKIDSTNILTVNKDQIVSEETNISIPINPSQKPIVPQLKEK